MSFVIFYVQSLNLLHSERPKLYGVLAILSAIVLKESSWHGILVVFRNVIWIDEQVPDSILTVKTQISFFINSLIRGVVFALICFNRFHKIPWYDENKEVSGYSFKGEATLLLSVLSSFSVGDNS